MIDVFALHAHWKALPRCGGYRIPKKSDFDPFKVPELLPFLSIYQRMGRYDMRSRLTGTAIDTAFGENLTGTNLFDLYKPEEHEFYARLHDVRRARGLYLYRRRHQTPYGPGGIRGPIGQAWA